MKLALVSIPILINIDFTRVFILDVDYTHGIGPILSQKERKDEKVVTYPSKGFSLVQKKFHPMEGEFYVLVWGIMFFQVFVLQPFHTLN